MGLKFEYWFSVGCLVDKAATPLACTMLKLACQLFNLSTNLLGSESLRSTVPDSKTWCSKCCLWVEGVQKAVAKSNDNLVTYRQPVPSERDSWLPSDVITTSSSHQHGVTCPRQFPLSQSAVLRSSLLYNYIVFNPHNKRLFSFPKAVSRL